MRKHLFFYNGYKPGGGGSNLVIKKFVPLLICSVGCLKTARKTTENRREPLKTARKTTESGTNLYKNGAKRGRGGQRLFITLIKKTDVFSRDGIPYSLIGWKLALI